MRIDHIIDYRALTVEHFTTYQLPDEIQQLIARNRSFLADIAATAGNTIASRARQEAISRIQAGRVDTFV